MSSGHSYPQQGNNVTDVSEELSRLDSDLRSNQVYSGEDAKPSTGETAAARDEMMTLCR
jgi:hypothetical protein